MWKSLLCMEMECMRTREQWLGDRLCSLHHPEDELIRQGASLLQTLCTSSSYPDVQKTAFWLKAHESSLCCCGTGAHMQADGAALHLLMLTNTLQRSLPIELVLAVAARQLRHIHVHRLGRGQSHQQCQEDKESESQRQNVS